MNNTNGYLSILTAIVQRQFGILGKEKALSGARQTGLSVLDNGNVTAFPGDGNSTVKRLIDCYVGYIGLPAKLGCVTLVKKIASEHGIVLPEL